jgi:hypothetical protein
MTVMNKVSSAESVGMFRLRKIAKVVQESLKKNRRPWRFSLRSDLTPYQVPGAGLSVTTPGFHVAVSDVRASGPTPRQ